MATPSRPTFTDVLDILTGRSPPPVSRFLSYSGELSPQQIQGLAEAIKGSSVQGGFRLKGCLLGDSGAEILASALASNRMIHTLELVGNGIGRPGAEALAACLTANTTLTSLDLADNPCEWDAADLLEAIGAVLQRNRRLASSNSDSHADSPTEPREPSASPSKSARDVVPPSGKENRAGTARTSATSRTSPVGADDFEHRLLYLETASDNVCREIARMRGNLTQVNEWEQRVDTLSSEVAAVFASVQTEQTTFRAWFDDLTSWQQRSETGCQRFSGELASLGGDLHSLYQHVMHMGSHGEDKAASMAYDKAQEVWDKCNEELEELHSRVHDTWQAHDQLVSVTGADYGITGQDLDSRLQALEQDMQQVHVKTEELDRHINKMLTKMVEFANQEQLRLKYDHNELKDRVAEAEQKVQDNLSGQHQDRAAFRTLQSQVAKLEFGEQRLQQQIAGMAEALEDMIRRKSPSVLWQLSHEAAVQDAADRLVKLEQGLVDANSYAETEAVRSAQTEAVLDGLLHFKTDTEAKLVAAQASLDHLLLPHSLSAHDHQQFTTSPQGENSTQLQMVIPKQQQLNNASPVASKSLQQIAMPQQQQQEEGVAVLRDQTNQQQLAPPHQIVEQKEAVPAAAKAGPSHSLWHSQMTHELQSQKAANAVLWQQVQSQQAVISSMQAQLAAVLRTTMAADILHDVASEAQPSVATDEVNGAGQACSPCCDEIASATTAAGTVQGAPADMRVAASCGTEHSHHSEEIVDDARDNDLTNTVTGDHSPSSASEEETRTVRQISDSHRRLTRANDDSSATVHHRHAASNAIPFRFFRTINAPHRFL
ncbi:hypothetical protein WJX77_010221 [Trebouxia sp. C0004]